MEEEIDKIKDQILVSMYLLGSDHPEVIEGLIFLASVVDDPARKIRILRRALSLARNWSFRKKILRLLIQVSPADRRSAQQCLWMVSALTSEWN